MATLAAFMLTACCLPIPWSAWRYEKTANFEGITYWWNLPDKEMFSDLYVGGAFVDVFVKAHNETTRSGDPPYQINVTVVAKTKEKKSIVFHSITVADTQGGNYPYQPITVNKAAKKTGELNFPVTFQLQEMNFHNQKTGSKNYLQARLRSDYSFNLEPENGAKLVVAVDIEVFGKSSTERKVITYEFIPHKESGEKRCLSF